MTDQLTPTRARTVTAILKGELFPLHYIIPELLPVQPGDCYLFDLDLIPRRLLAFEHYYGKKTQEYDARRVTIHTEIFNSPEDRIVAISLLESRIRNAKRKSRNAKVIFDILMGEALAKRPAETVSIRQNFQVVAVKE